MKTKLLYFLLGMVALVSIAAQLQTYPIVTTVGSADLFPFSQNIGGGMWNSPVNITAPNLAAQLAIQGNYPTLAGNQTWGGNNTFTLQVVAGGLNVTAPSIFQAAANVTFSGSVTTPSIGGPPNSLLRSDTSFALKAVTIGSNLNLDGNGVLSATFSVATNNISLPLAITNGGTGSTTASAALLNLGGVSLTGNNSIIGLDSFANISYSGAATNRLLVLENFGGSNTLVDIGASPGNGYALFSTNTAPGVFWAQLPNNGTATTRGSITATGWTNTSGLYEDVAVNTGANTFDIYDGAGNNWASFGYGSSGATIMVSLQPNGAIVYTSGAGLSGKWHVH